MAFSSASISIASETHAAMGARWWLTFACETTSRRCSSLAVSLRVSKASGRAGVPARSLETITAASVGLSSPLSSSAAWARALLKRVPAPALTAIDRLLSNTTTASLFRRAPQLPVARLIGSATVTASSASIAARSTSSSQCCIRLRRAVFSMLIRKNRSVGNGASFARTLESKCSRNGTAAPSTPIRSSGLTNHSAGITSPAPFAWPGSRAASGRKAYPSSSGHIQCSGRSTPCGSTR